MIIIIRSLSLYRFPPQCQIDSFKTISLYTRKPRPFYWDTCFCVELNLSIEKLTYSFVNVPFF